jgi:tripartite-type tricarboxylate transporter receptor subunit TctC
MPILKQSPLRRTRLVLVVAALATLTTFACAQNFPTRTITVVVPIAAGGSTDVITRRVTKHMSESLS